MNNFSLDDFDYYLPQERIAQYPLPDRDQSNLLVFYPSKIIEHHKFFELPNLLPKGSLLLRNSSKVIPARFFLQKQSGGKVEILLLEPTYPSSDPQLALSSREKCSWKVLMRGKNLKTGLQLVLPNYSERNFDMICTINEKNEDHYIVDFEWANENLQFSEILEYLGKIPLPPYIHRDDEELDKERYQTIYGDQLGSVASHTAGLHFSNNVINELTKNNIDFADITLHIGLGTFKPIQSSNIFSHKMHEEKFSVSLTTLNKIYQFLSNRKEHQIFVAVGTTSVRTLESIFWLAQKIYNNKENVIAGNFDISQYIWKETIASLTPIQSLEILLEKMHLNKLEKIEGKTRLYITPDYKINFFEAIITNFHQPKSTLLLLIYSFVGNEWKRIYKEALEKNYRFLSYGDASLLFNINK